MENAVNALKIAFAIFVFMLGLVILFSMASQARETADILISEADKTTYYSYHEDVSGNKVDANGNRIVTISDIIPVLYRYAEENYGVTIVDNLGNIVARFDLDTETACNNWPTYSEEDKNNFIFGSEMTVGDETTRKGGINYIINRINAIIGSNKISNINDSATMEELFKKLYQQNTNASITRNYYCYWAR